MTLEELCAAKHWGPCVGFVECDLLSPHQRRTLLVARATRLREEDAVAGPLLAGAAHERTAVPAELRKALLNERERIVVENRRLETEMTALEGVLGREEITDDVERGVGPRGGDVRERLTVGRLDSTDRALDANHSAIAIGYAENDHSLLETCELGVAVGNAVDALKAHADLVLDEPEGAGVAAFLRGPVLRGEVRIEPKRWQLELGRYDDGSHVRLPASQINVLITGRSKSGKSYLAGSLAEQLIGLGYSVCVIDPEGHYEPIGHLRGVLWVDGHGELLPAGGIERLIEHLFGSVVVDVSALDGPSRDVYVRSVLAQLERERVATGPPHWIIIDEAHVPFGRDADTSEYFDPSQKGYCFVTYQPGELKPDLWKELDVVLALPTGRRPVPPAMPTRSP